MYVVGFSCVLIGLVSCFGWLLSPKDILILINFLFDWFDFWVALACGYFGWASCLVIFLLALWWVSVLIG